MAYKPRKKTTDRITKPTLDIDWKVVDALLKAGCNGMEISANLGVCHDTLYIRCATEKKMTFSAYAQEKRASGDSLLRDVQFKKALSGDNTMLVWLGKNRLKQSDCPEELVTTQQTIEHFTKLMNQVSSLQSSPKMLESKISKE